MENKIKILLVEDKKTIGDLIELLLSEVEKKIEVAKSGEVALNKLVESVYDVLILDIQLATSMTGFEMLKQAKKQMINIPPVIVLSDFDSYKNYREAVYLGVFDFIPKHQLNEHFKEIVIAATQSETDIRKVKHCFKHYRNNCESLVRIGKNSVFVGIPFKKTATYKAIKEVVESFGLECKRADEILRSGDFSCKICSIIQNCVFAVFDISDLNPNVFLEIGFACAEGKNMFLLKERSISIPTNLSGIEPIEYSSIPMLKEKLKSYLKAFLEEQMINN